MKPAYFCYLSEQNNLAHSPNQQKNSIFSFILLEVPERPRAKMMWDEWEDDAHERSGGTEQGDYSHLNFDFSSLLSKPKVFYFILHFLLSHLFFFLQLGFTHERTLSILNFDFYM